MGTEKLPEYKISFEEILNRAQLERKLDPTITQTAKHMIAASYFEEKRDILENVRECLMKEDPRKLFMNCLHFLVKKIQSSDSANRYMWVERLDSLGIRGLGLTIDDLEFAGDSKNIFRAEPNWEKIEKHIENVVLGDYFIEKISVPSDDDLWGSEFSFRITACDASQHRFKLTLPFYNKSFTTPIVINNAAGIVKERKDGKAEWDKVVVPKNTQDFENWVVVGFDDYKNLSDDDYEWATKSAMDVGQYYVEESFIFAHGGSSKKPDIHFRDGTVFVQDHAMNCRLQNRHGELTREAILRMTQTLKRAKDLKILFCGVSKNVQLSIFSIIIDYYIKEVMGDTKWNITETILPDSDVIRYILYNKNFDASTFNEIYITCAVVRSFYVKTNFNNRSQKQAQNDLKSLESILHLRGITAREIVEKALDTKVVMFFVGHFNSDEFYVPRYEFVYYDDKSIVRDNIIRVLSAIRLSSLELDEDHPRTFERPILLPVPIMYSHDLSKAMGDELKRSWLGRTWEEYLKLKNNMESTKSQ